MFGRFSSINPPQPELLIDIKRENKANSDYSDTGYPYIHNYGSSGGGAAYACLAANLKSPELYYNPWNLTNPDRCEAIELKTGVWHITKLTPPSTNSFNSILFSCPVSGFKGIETKFGIFISKPEGREFNYALFYNGNDDTGERFFSQFVVEGMNIIDLSEVHENPNLFWRLKVPESFYNRDESGGLLETETNFYIVFFPILDESQCNGYGEYLCPKFNNAVWRKDSENIVVSDDGLIVDTTQSEHFWDLRIVPEAYYKDDYIAVYSPEFFNVSCAQNINIITEFRGITGDGSTERIGTEQVIGRTTGTNVPFYGGVVFKESYDSVYFQIYFSAKGVFTMLPYNNDRFTVALSLTKNNYGRLMISETEYFHDKSELQTLITKYRNTYKGNSRLYRNEVSSTNEDLLGIYGFRLCTFAENNTQYSHRYCIIDAAQSRWENLVSYCNNTIVTNQITDYELLYKDTVSAVVLLNNEEITDEDCVNTGSLLFSSGDVANCFSGLLYYLIGFKNRLTPWQIAYQIKQMN